MWRGAQSLTYGSVKAGGGEQQMSGRLKRAVASVVACALVSGVALAMALPGATAADTDHWASGVYPGPCKNVNDQSRIDYVNQLRSFGSWRNHPVELTMQFAPYKARPTGSPTRSRTRCSSARCTCANSCTFP